MTSLLAVRAAAPLVGALCLLAAAPAFAADWTAGSTTITLSASAGFGVFAEPNAVFGAGSYDIRKARDFLQGHAPDAGTPASTSVWFEGFVTPNLRVAQDLGDGQSLFADVSVAFAKTMGDGDASPYSTTPGYPGSIDIEEAYLGYRRPPPFGWAGDSVVVQFGRQDFVIDDGFLVQLGRFDVGRSASVYLSPHIAFDGWGTVRINTSPIRGDVFVLDADVDNRRAYGNAAFPADQPASSLAGFDIEWFENADRKGAAGALNYLDRDRYVNFTYFNIYRADSDRALYGNNGLFWARRDGLNVFSLAGGGNLIPVKDTTLYFQYVRQINPNPGRKVDAVGYYVEPGYTFSDIPWTPHAYYRYSRFSGQPGVPGEAGATKHNYDFLFLGGGIRDLFGNFSPGEIVGNFLAPPTNLIVHSISLKLATPLHILRPTDSLSLELLGYAFLLDHPEQVRATARQYAHEIDLTAQYSFDESTTAAFATGIAIPEKGGRQAIASLTVPLAGARRIGSDTYVAEFFVFRTF